MKKLSLITLFYSFIISANLYCFDLLEDVDDFFDESDDIAKIIGIIFMILATMFIVRRFLIINERNSFEKGYNYFSTEDTSKENDTENDLQEKNLNNNSHIKDGKENNSKYKKDNDIIIK